MSMRATSTCLALALASAAACEHEGLPPPVTEASSTTGSEASSTSEPAPLGQCGDGLVNDDGVCLRSFTVDLPYAHEFIRYADVDGDGQRDLFAINSIWRVFGAIFFKGGLENGTPELLGHTAFEQYESYREVVLDFDGDGLMDFAAAAQFWYFLGKLEISSNELVVWRNRGDYVFEIAADAYAQREPNLVASFAVGDIDGDGRDDLLGANDPSDVFVWAYVPEKDDIGRVHELDLEPLQLAGGTLLAAADHNGDAHADFVLMDNTGRAWRIVGGPEYQLTVLDPLAQDVVLTPGSQTLHARDFNGDGLVDLAAVRLDDSSGDLTHTVSLALGRPGGGFTALASFDTAHLMTWAAFEFVAMDQIVAHLGFFDFDGSGQLALVYAHRERAELVIHPRIAETRGESPMIVPLDFPANSLFVDDFEGDGEDAIYVTMSDVTLVEPSVENPDGRISEHSMVRLTPDP